MKNGKKVFNLFGSGRETTNFRNSKTFEKLWNEYCINNTSETYLRSCWPMFVQGVRSKDRIGTSKTLVTLVLIRKKSYIPRISGFELFSKYILHLEH